MKNGYSFSLNTGTKYSKENKRSMMTLFLITTVFGIICFATVSDSLPVIDESEAALYLQKYGYIDESNDVPSNSEALRPQDAVSTVIAFSRAIKDFQRFAGLKETGELDAETVAMMKLPRCGVKDRIKHSESARKKRWALEGSKWRLKLTYRITKYPPGLKDKAKVDREIARAFKIWSDVTTVYFKEKPSGPVNIEISFEDRDHGDGFLFDGAEGTLAHAFFPQYGGDVHFDKEEKWTINEKIGKNLFQIATHEIGHTLGLYHSDEENAVMYPFYTGYNPWFKIHSDDIEAVQTLYGSQDQPASPVEEDEDTVETTTATVDAPNLCQDASLDAVTRLKNGTTYIFKGDFYWKYLCDSIVEGYPKKISVGWEGLEGNLDAALSLSNGKTFFFKGRRYWRFTNTKLDTGYPKLISEGFRGIPDYLDAAIVWNGNGKIYFFKGNKYWRYDSNYDLSTNAVSAENYPASITAWKGLPADGIDAAVPWKDDVSYFFKRQKYYRFNDKTSQVENWNPPYPLPTATEWFSC